MDSIGRYARGKNIGIPLLFSMLYSWWGIMFENTLLWKSDGPLSPTHSPSLCLLLSLTQTHSQYDRWSWSLDNAGTSEFVMNTSSILMAWESPERCQAPLKRNMDFHFKRALLRTKSGRREGQTRPPHTWQGPTWAAVQRPFTVSDSNRGVHLRTSVAASASSASWQVADLRSCVMIRIKVRAKQHEEIHKRYLAF